MAYGVSIIVGFKNRDLQRVKIALGSFSQQSSKSFELIFVDYGSTDMISESVKEFITSLPFAKYIYVYSDGWFWNRAHALNIGVKHAQYNTLLFYDIDLIVEPNFIQKILSLDFSSQFYTFSCYYLPEEFIINQFNLKNIATQLFQNYVGLCAVSKQAINTLQGFDEYYFVWGVEDDDLYERLILNGLSHSKFNANQINVYHQWHKSESPSKPSIWYLTMVSYLYQKQKVKIENKEWGSCTKISDRKLLNNERVISNKLSFSNDFNLYYFNSFIKAIYQLESGQIVHIEYKDQNSQVKERTWNIKSLFKKKGNINNPPEHFNKKEIVSFIQYFIGSNRHLIDDYFINITDDIITILILIK